MDADAPVHDKAALVPRAEYEQIQRRSFHQGQHHLRRSVLLLLILISGHTPELIRRYTGKEKQESRNFDFNGKRILLCEDNEINSLIAIKMLVEKGIIVEKAENGQIGLDKYLEKEDGYY